MKKMLVVIVLLLLPTVSAAFEIGEFKFRNKLELFHVDNDSGNYDKQLIYDIKLSKKGLPIYVQNRYQVDYDGDLDERYYFKTTLGFKVLPRMDVLLQRQEYSYKKTDDVVYRAGIGLEF